MTSAELAIASAMTEAATATGDACGDPWSTAPLDASTVDALRPIVARLGPAQRLWLSGFLAGSTANAAAAQTPSAASPATVTVLYGSQSGNSQALAHRLAKSLAARSVAARVLDMLDCRKKDLEGAQTLLVIVSTHGNGEPPDCAVALHELLHGRRAPQLAHLRYSVLALGDSSYEKFCETGRQFDARLEALGAQRIEPRAECDVDFAARADAWMTAVAAKVAAATGDTVAAPVSLAREPSPQPRVHSRKNPFAATVLANQRLTARGSSKDVRHLELSLAGSGIRYEPGDALGIVPRNRPEDVDAVLAAAGLAPEAPVERDGRGLSLRDALLERCEIGTVGATFLQRYAAAIGGTALEALGTDELELARYAHGRDLLDVVRDHPPRGLDAAAFVGLLKPLAPRLYSIASSALAVEDEVHLTVGVVEYESHGRARRGVVSGLVAETAEDATLPVYVQRNTAFRLPKDPSTDVVMIAAGTGVAPFRAFVAEREAAGATGRNWLIFGDRSFELDFLYQSEWLAWRKSRVLTRIDVAFSRDQAHKVYVQHRLRERGADLWAWLEGGAAVYVCGDAARMAPDVERALHDVARTRGGRDDDGARDYWHELKRAQRYQRDVY